MAGWKLATTTNGSSLPSLRARVYGFDDARALSPLICLSVPFDPSLSPSLSPSATFQALNCITLILLTIRYVSYSVSRPATLVSTAPPPPRERVTLKYVVSLDVLHLLLLIVKSLSASSRLKRGGGGRERGEREGKEGALACSCKLIKYRARIWARICPHFRI